MNNLELKKNDFNFHLKMTFNKPTPMLIKKIL